MKEKYVVGIYVRVSTQEQAREGYSVGEQEERLKALCAAKDWIIYRLYTDPGFSGSNMSRPALQNMIRDIDAKKINMVLVYKLDRLSRSQKDTLFLIEDVFLKKNIHFVSMNENLDTTTPYGRAMIGILSAFAQLEREQIKERSRMGREARAKDGNFHGGGFAPIGYDYVNKKLIVNDYEAAQIKKIVDYYTIDKMPITAIKNTLNAAGYTRKGHAWTDTSVRSVLFTPVYAGKIMFCGNEYAGQHDAIYDDDTAARIAQERATRDMSVKSSNRAQPFKHTSLLGGLLFCAHCGGRYFTKQINHRKGINKEPWKYYICYSRAKPTKHMIRDENCKNKMWRMEKLDALIIDEIKKLSFDHSLITTIAAADTLDNDAERKNAIADRILKIDAQLSRLTDLFATGEIDIDLVIDKIKNLKNEKDSLTVEMQAIESSTPAPALDTIDAASIADQIASAIDTASRDDLRALLAELIDRIEIDNDDIKIYWKFA